MARNWTVLMFLKGGGDIHKFVSLLVVVVHSVKMRWCGEYWQKTQTPVCPSLVWRFAIANLLILQSVCIHPWSNEVGLDWLCCPGIALEPIRQTSSHAIRQGTLVHSRLGSLNHCEILACQEKATTTCRFSKSMWPSDQGNGLGTARFSRFESRLRQ